MTATPSNNNAGLINCGLVRAIDGLVYALTAAGMLVLVPALRNNAVARLGNWHLLPLALAVAATFRIPFDELPGGRPGLLPERLRLAAAACLGLAPFCSWWQRSDGNLYLLVCSGLGLCACCWYLMELLRLAQHLARGRCLWLHRLAGATCWALFYLSLIPVLSIYITFVVGYFTIPGVGLLDLQRLWGMLPDVCNAVLVLPVAAAVAVLWCLAAVLPRLGAGVSATNSPVVLPGMAPPRANEPEEESIKNEAKDPIDRRP